MPTNRSASVLEKQRVNLLQYSELASNAVWTKMACSVGTPLTQNDIRLDLIIEDTSTSTHQVTQVYAFTSGITYTFSRIVKAKERSRLYMTLGSGAFSGFAIGDFNLSSVTAASVGGTTARCEIVPLGDGLFRCSVTATATGSASVNCITQLHNGTSNSYTGNGTSGLYIGAAQLEVGSVATKYIRTPST